MANRKVASPKRRTNIALLPALKKSATRLAFSQGKSFSGFISELLLREVQHSQPVKR